MICERGFSTNTKRKIETRKRKMIANPTNPAAFLKENGYVYLRKTEIPDAMLSRAADIVERDVLELQKEKLDFHQEQPIDLLSKETTEVMTQIKDWVLKHIIHPTFTRDADVPQTWSTQQTMYGRVKKRNEFTRPHCDAYNTVVKRKLTDYDSTKSFVADDLPIYTVWIPLKDTTPKSSVLRVQPRTHVLPNIEFQDEFIGVVPRHYKPLSKHFVRPKSPYLAGDIVIFHCLTQHDATPHRARKGHRVSMDFRMKMNPNELISDDHGNRKPVKRRRLETSERTDS